ncbi:YceD family protein [Thermorudis peleae]|uniref:YceD family protein n=1 Tax=Thermorudis peleae TaxID=1382356 RepID=UPI00068A1E5D|nr:YceD family protein [Thermorudis peleae]MBX6753937.1 DUF177 domain-containing protein [Thermorudis peleae]
MQPQQLYNDTVLNVAQLLKARVGAERRIDVHLDALELDVDLPTQRVEAHLRLTRITSGILVTGDVQVTGHQVCARCLTEFDGTYTETVSAEFWPSIDVETGAPLPLPEDDETFIIDENHQLDLNELLRQVAILAQPLRPVCGPDCPGFESLLPPEAMPVDDRLAVLASLLLEN